MALGNPGAFFIFGDLLSVNKEEKNDSCSGKQDYKGSQG
jgi:hypothetical protein